LVQEPSEEDTIAILCGIKEKYEASSGLSGSVSRTRWLWMEILEGRFSVVIDREGGGLVLTTHHF